MSRVLDSFKLDGKVALVTGGAGLYGRQIVEALAEAGAKTFMASRNIAAQERQAATFRQAGLDVTALQLDQSNEASIHAALKEIIDRAGRCDILVNNAVWRPPAEMPLFEAFAKSMEINATGIVMMTEIFGGHMGEHGGGSIINIGSIYGMVGPDFTLYGGTAMRAPVDYFTSPRAACCSSPATPPRRWARRECASTASAPAASSTTSPRPSSKRYCPRTFVGRMANQSDLKGVIVLLASDASAYITGANIPVDGGLTAK